jgi:glyoxylase-like metal-dependent hydrolase (beta-lactamase superfamily II)/rhodanese-related sulfurtransferase
MILKRSFVDGLAHASYLIECERTKAAAVIDPQRDIEPYLEEARRLGAKITHVLLTHVHADFIAGHGELAERCGAKVCIGKDADAKFPHEALADHAQIALGDVRIEALATPGHTPESMCFLATDAKSGQQCLFTGDTLFIGDVGRPDLFGVEKARELARSLYTSITQGLFPLGDKVTVAPAHGAGSLCGKSLSSEPYSTLGEQKRDNSAIAGKDEKRFVDDLLADQPQAPPQFAINAKTNREGPPLLQTLPMPQALDVYDVEARIKRGAIVIDTRDSDAFKLSHIPGSLYLGSKPTSHTWAMWLVPKDTDLILLTEDASEVQEATRKLHRVGFDRVIGFVNRGIDAWDHAGEHLGTLRDLTPAALHHLREKGDAPRLLDVRQPGEYRAGHPVEARHQPLGLLPQVAHRYVHDGPLAVICATGNRSVIACSVLMRAGKADVYNVPGGHKAWQEAGFPVER